MIRASFPDIVAAMSDTRLFGAFYQGSTWDGWKTVLKAAHGLPMTAEEIAFFKIVAGNRNPSGRRCKELVLAIGRRGGKDAIAALIAAYAAMTFKPDGRVRAGERPLILLLSADRSTQSRNLLRYVRALFEVPALKALIRRETQDGFELSNGCDVSVGTADWRTIRGRTVLLCIMNELAFWRDENSSNPDREIYRAVVPAMATLGDQAMIVMISSVHRRAGLLYEKWAKHYGENDPHTLVITGGTRQFNPTIDQQIIDDALADDPQSAAAEYLNCQWRDDLAGYITRDEIMAVTDRGVMVRPPQIGIQYQAHLDASSGQGKDSLCCAVGHKIGDISVIDCVIEIAPPFQPSEAIARVSGVLRSYNGLSAVTCDRWGLGFVEQELQRHGITPTYSDRNSSELFRQALPIIMSQRCRLVEHERAITQFTSLERRALPGGGERISHPNRSGHHDDVAVVIAGCLVTLSQELRGADGWVEYYRQLAEKEGSQVDFNGIGLIDTDVDGIRAAGPAFGYGFTTEPLLNIVLPSVLASGTSGVRYIEGKPCIQCTRAGVKDWLRRPAIAELNQELVRELIGETGQ